MLRVDVPPAVRISVDPGYVGVGRSGRHPRAGEQHPVHRAPLDVSGDPWAARVEAAERRALHDRGPRWRRWADVVTWTHTVLTHADWIDVFPEAPIDVDIVRRSHSAHYALAHFESATIAIPDGAWSAEIVLHELAHLAAPGAPAHGPGFVSAELHLVRRFLGIDAWAAFTAALAAEGIGG